MNTKKRSLWLELILVILTPVIGMALGVGVNFLLGLNQTDYSNLIINLFFLLVGVVLVFIFKFSREEVGLGLIKEQAKQHVILSLVISIFYVLFYIFVIHVSALKPLSASMYQGLLTYLVVVLAEELYFRGLLYRFFEIRFSARTALIVSSLLFGLFHAQQGLSGMVSRTFAGWLWGSVRYSTGMIFLLIFPIHFMYNATWLLFEGSWNNPPVWAIYALPAFEFILGLVIVLIHGKQSENA